jgi:hypothetical protein
MSGFANSQFTTATTSTQTASTTITASAGGYIDVRGNVTFRMAAANVSPQTVSCTVLVDGGSAGQQMLDSFDVYNAADNRYRSMSCGGVTFANAGSHTVTLQVTGATNSGIYFYTYDINAFDVA